MEIPVKVSTSVRSKVNTFVRTKVSKERLMNACKRALEFNIHNYKIVQNILEKGLDQVNNESEDNQNRMALLEIIEDRHGKGSVIITSQLPVSGWYDIIGEKTVADAILDRIVHEAHRIDLMGESMRKTRKKVYPETEAISN